MKMEQLQNRILDLGKGWCFKFNITTSMCEIGSCRVIIKGVERCL